ncbi:MAG: MFS transporter [Arcobacteraceae bacterium]
MLNILFRTVIFSCSIFIITLIGYLDTKKNLLEYTFKQFSISIDIEKKSIEESLNDGYKLESFIGYERLFDRIISSDESILNTYITDENDVILFEHNKNILNFENITFLKKIEDTTVFETSQEFILKTEIKFNNSYTKGFLYTISNKNKIFLELNKQFYLLLLLFVFIMLILIALMFLEKKEENHKTFYQLLKPLIVGQIFYIIVLLYFTNSLLLNALEEQNRALINNIAAKINHATSLNIPINRISGVDIILQQYIKEYDSLAWANIKKDTNFMYDITKPEINTIEYKLSLAEQNLSIYFSIPIHIIYSKILNNIKDFIFLLFASSLISYFLFNILLIETNNKNKIWQNELLLIKPLVFFIFLTETFNISFLPKYFEHIVLINNINESHIKYLFSVYFLFFVLSFFPATILVKKYGTKITFLLSAFFVGTGAVLLFYSTDYYLIIVARILSGLSLGFLLISTENHLIQSLPSDKRQLVAATTITLYNAAIIGGAILGSLTYNYLDIKIIFIFEAVVAVLTILYTVKFVEAKYADKINVDILSFRKKLKLFFDFELIKTMFFTGFFSKITLSGVIFVALPLILSRYDFSKIEIGQIVAFYSIGILIGGVLISKYKITKTNENTKVLFLGILLSGLSMIGMGALNWVDNIYFITLCLLVSLSVLGISHAIISSFLLPNIFNFGITKHMGITHVRPIALTYERAGNIFGPLIMMQLLLLFDYSFLAIFVLGLAGIVFGIIYNVYFKTKSH